MFEWALVRCFSVLFYFFKREEQFPKYTVPFKGTRMELSLWTIGEPGSEDCFLGHSPGCQGGIMLGLSHPLGMSPHPSAPNMLLPCGQRHGSQGCAGVGGNLLMGNYKFTAAVLFYIFVN